jgi:hypothetical protein
VTLVMHWSSVLATRKPSYPHCRAVPIAVIAEYFPPVVVESASKIEAFAEIRDRPDEIVMRQPSLR